MPATAAPQPTPADACAVCWEPADNDYAPEVLALHLDEAGEIDWAHPSCGEHAGANLLTPAQAAEYLAR